MGLEFRELRNDDIKEVLSLFEALRNEGAGVSFTEYDSDEQIREWINNPNVFVYAALSEERIAGVFKARREDRNNGHSAFLTCAVHKSLRRSGIARALTEYGLERIRQAGFKIARAYIYSDNKPSVNTILSCGFEQSGRVYMHHLDDKTGKYVDDLIFHKVL